MNRPQLTISLLASNRPEQLRRCLESLRIIMDSISCELILVDTSKSPVVHSMLLEYTDQVYNFDWCNDFAKARNEGLSRANGEWFLYLDDDEWFVETEALIKFFKSGEYKKYGYANYQVRNFLDEKMTNYSDCWVSRMIRVDEDTCFLSKIHEYFSPLKGARKDLHALVYHSGYVYKNHEEERSHFERNSSLLLAMIEEEPENIRWQTHLAQEYCTMGEWESLEVFCRQSLEKATKLETIHERIHAGTFYVGLVYSLLNLKKYSECVQLCKQILSDKWSTDVLKSLIHLKLGEAYFRLGEYEVALEYVKAYLYKLNTINQNDSAILEQKLVLLVCNAFELNNQRTAYNLLICSQLELNNMKDVIKYYDKLGWNQPIVCMIEDVEKYWVKAIWTQTYEPIFAQVMVDVLKNRNLRELFCKEILTQNTEELSNFQIILYTFAESRQGVVAGPTDGNMIDYHNMLQYYVQATCQWYDFLQEQELLGLLGETNPGYIEAAIALSDYMELETQDRIQALGVLKEAVEHVPEFADGIGAFLQSYAELENQRAKQRSAEMEALRIQVIGQVKAMIESGQKAAAEQILEQLKQMFPGDVEIEALAEKLR